MTTEEKPKEEKSKNILTGRGELRHVTPGKLDQWNSHSLVIVLSKEDGEKITEMVRQEARRKYLECKANGEKLAPGTGYSNPPFTVQEDGRILFQFSENEIGGPKDNPAKQFAYKIDYMDKDLHPWPESLLVGNGSIGRVAFVLWSWNVMSKQGVGVTLKLRGCQIIQHVPYEPPPRTCGFSEEEGTTIDHGAFTGGENTGEAGGPGDIPMGETPDDSPPPF